MAKDPLKLANAEKTWLSTDTQKQIRSLYKNLAKQAEKEAQSIPGETVSQNLRTVYLDEFIKELHKEVNRMDKSIEDAIKAGMSQVSVAVVDANVDFMKSVGLNMSGAFSYVPTQVVESLVSGKVYRGDWTLSKSLWQSGNKVTRDVESIVAAGIAGQKPTYDIAKDIEKYLNPEAKKPWDWSKVYPGTSLKVDYSAQRAARTLIQHSYQLSYRRTAQNNPFIEKFIWRSAHSERTCELCEERDGTMYDIGHEPLDHPQGLCYLESYIPKSNEEMADMLADWAQGKADPDFEKAMEQYVSKGYNIGKGTQKLKEKVESIKEQSKNGLAPERWCTTRNCEGIRGVQTTAGRSQ